MYSLQPADQRASESPHSWMKHKGKRQLASGAPDKVAMMIHFWRELDYKQPRWRTSLGRHGWTKSNVTQEIFLDIHFLCVIMEDGYPARPRRGIFYIKILTQLCTYMLESSCRSCCFYSDKTGSCRWLTEVDNHKHKQDPMEYLGSKKNENGTKAHATHLHNRTHLEKYI